MLLVSDGLFCLQLSIAYNLHIKRRYANDLVIIVAFLRFAIGGCFQCTFVDSFCFCILFKLSVF